MSTHAERLNQLVNEAIARAERLASATHRSYDLFPTYQTLASSLEVFLKAHAFPSSSAHTNLYTLIENLAARGLSSKATAILHRLREDYNKSKHDTRFAPATYESLKFFEEVRIAIHNVAQLNVGNSGREASEGARHLFWLGFWDHYIGGDTEVAVVLPLRTTFLPLAIDQIHVEMSSWETIKVALPQVGSFHRGKDSIPHDIYDSWAREGDFLDAGVFEGSYQKLISLLAKHERREILLPHLMRENQRDSMRAAAVFAMTDAARAGLLADAADLEPAILRTAGTSYAAPGHSKMLQHFVRLLARTISKFSPTQRGMLEGPIWKLPEDFSAEVSRGAERVGDADVAITADLRVLVGLTLMT